MSYDIYVNETYVGPMANNGGWSAFIEWGSRLSLKHYGEIVRLSEHSYVSALTTLRLQLERAIDKDRVPADLVPLANRLIRASKKLNGEPESESILWITDGVDELMNEMIPAGDPDHAGPDDEDDESEDDSETSE